MNFTLLGIVVLLVIQLGLWLMIKRFRSATDATPPVSFAVTYREAGLWLASTIIVLILLALLLVHVYRREYARPETAAHPSTIQMISPGIRKTGTPLW